MGGGFPIKAFGNDKLVLTEVGNGQCITYLPNIYNAEGAKRKKLGSWEVGKLKG